MSWNCKGLVNMMVNKNQPLVLLTGATGYIGGRLLKRLEQRDVQLRCLARQPRRLAQRVAAKTEIVQGDVLDRDSLDAALVGVETAFYLVHSMNSEGDFESEDCQAATNFALAAREAGVKRIIYVGGLGDSRGALSPHLRSRQDVGRALQQARCQVIELRASIVIGSGSLSFELVRSLVERLPLMICPKWVATFAQPIAIEDLLEYLLAALDWDQEESRVFEIGGPDRATYGDIMREYAKQRGLRRYLISVPVLTPRLSSLWLGLITPIYARVGRKLVESMRNPTVVNDDSALACFAVRPRGLKEAIARAILNEDGELAQTRWSDALSSAAQPRRRVRMRFGNRILDSRTVEVQAPAAAAFAPIRQIGGTRGWYCANSLWKLRGWIDLLIGGVGGRRGRRSAVDLQVGDVVDSWRVESYETNRMIRLSAEMKLPGRAWLEFEVSPTEKGVTIRQTAIFDPVGLSGRLYWYVMLPFHSVIFSGMLKRIARLAVTEEPVA